MLKPHEILGMNARNSLYTSQNSGRSKSICNSKYATKLLLVNKNIPTAEIHGILALNEDVNDFDWMKLGSNFVIKPTDGHAGKGVVAFKKYLELEGVWVDIVGEKWKLDDIKLHCFDILEGLYSTFERDHHVLIEERIVSHPSLQKYAYKGTPDIRIIVYNDIPVMGMLRLPTVESGGRANLSQGAIGAGIDMATGVTTFASADLQTLLTFLPGTKKKLNGIKIPFWRETLRTAIEAARSAELSFSGIDIFIHETKGPMVVELNASPGLSIQVCNQAGLRRRLERVDGLNVLNTDHGVRISQSLFAENFSDKIKAEEGLAIVSAFEEVVVRGDTKQQVSVQALINTGRYRTAISNELAKKLGLLDLDDILWYQPDKDEAKAPVVEITITIKKRKIKTSAVVLRSLQRSKHQIEIGRKDLQGFLVGDN